MEGFVLEESPVGKSDQCRVPVEGGGDDAVEHPLGDVEVKFISPSGQSPGGAHSSRYKTVRRIAAALKGACTQKAPNVTFAHKRNAQSMMMRKSEAELLYLAVNPLRQTKPFPKSHAGTQPGSAILLEHWRRKIGRGRHADDSKKAPGTEDLSRFRDGGQMVKYRNPPQERDKTECNYPAAFRNLGKMEQDCCQGRGR
jgi:hypothetical protein